MIEFFLMMHKDRFKGAGSLKNTCTLVCLKILLTSSLRPGNIREGDEDISLGL